jgi:hypothetical protein
MISLPQSAARAAPAPEPVERPVGVHAIEARTGYGRLIEG